MKTGKFLGEGKGRKVYNHPINKKWIIKVNYSKINQNIIEFEIWNLIKNTKYEKYFCPCISIFEDGKYLIAMKAKKTSKKINLPKELKNIPKADITKNANIGKYGDNVVVIDYGNPNLLKGIKKIVAKE